MPRASSVCSYYDFIFIDFCWLLFPTVPRQKPAGPMCVLLCFIKPILGNRYGPGIIPLGRGPEVAGSSPCTLTTSLVTPVPSSSSSNGVTASIKYIPFQVIIFQKSILLIVQYKYSKSCSEDFFLKNPTKIWSSAQDHAVLHLLLNTVGFFISDRAEICLFEMICTTVVPASKGHLGGASPWIFLHDS